MNIQRGVESHGDDVRLLDARSRDGARKPERGAAQRVAESSLGGNGNRCSCQPDGNL